MSKILVVDDSETLRAKLTGILESLGHQVVQADCGDVGLKMMLENQDIALIFSDFHMPGMDGLMMCSKRLEYAELPKVPIIMMTTETGVGLKERGRTVGIKAWIIKPLDENNLREAVRIMLPS